MDFLTLLGVVLALGAILVGQMLEGGSLNALINLPALVIVLGGSIGAVLAETPSKLFLSSYKVVTLDLLTTRV